MESPQAGPRPATLGDNEITGLPAKTCKCRRFFCSASFGPQPNHDVDTADLITLRHWRQLADN
jgi:hypothetical protein